MTPEARLRQRVRFPVLALSSAAWVALVIVGMPMPEPDDPASAGTLTMGRQPAAAGGHEHLLAAGAPMSTVPHVAAAGLMITAMMAPLLIPALRHVLDRSLPQRRARAAALLACCYTATWGAAWVVLVALAAAMTSLLGAVPALLAGVALAAIWQLSPAKQRYLNRCHARPALAAFGWPADRDAAVFGLRHAVACVGSCWALMLLPLLVAGHLPLAMAAVALWMWSERFEAAHPPQWHLRVPSASVRIVAAQVRAKARPASGLRSSA